MQRIAKLNEPLEAATREVFAPLKARVQRGRRTYRYETVIEAIRDRETFVPRDGRLNVDCQLERKSLRLVETRLTGSEYSKDEWQDEHVGALLISDLIMEASKERTKLYAEIVGLVTFHCLSRWYERTSDQGEPVLMNDLLAMARAHKQIGAAARSHSEKKWEWRLAPSGIRFAGTWCYREQKGVRTFFIGADTCKIDQLVRWAA